MTILHDKLIYSLIMILKTKIYIKYCVLFTLIMSDVAYQKVLFSLFRYLKII